MYNVVNFDLSAWFKFYFPLCLGMVIYDLMSLKQKEIKFKPRLKLNNNTHTWGRKFVAPKAAHPKVAGGVGGGELFLNLGSLIFSIFHSTFSAN